MMLRYGGLKPAAKSTLPEAAKSKDQSSLSFLFFQSRHCLPAHSSAKTLHAMRWVPPGKSAPKVFDSRGKNTQNLAHLAEHAIGLRYGDHGPFQGHLYPFTPLHFCDSLPCRKPCHDHHEDPLCHEHRYIWDPSCTTQTANASKAPPAKKTLQLGFLLKFLNL